MATPIDRHFLEIHKLFDEELFLMHGRNHELATKKSIRISDIDSYPMLLLDQSHCLSAQVESFCKQRSIQPIALERAAQLTTVQAMVAIGHGIAFIPSMARTRGGSTRSQYRSLEGVKPKRTVIMVWNPYRFQSRLVQKLRQFIIEAVEIVESE